jgi:Domain of unknown function (DUF4258)
MRTTIHAQQRMSQRGINRSMVDLCLEHGKIDRNKVLLGRKDAEDLLAEMQDRMKVLKKIIDKGGITVISDNNTLITTYNYK